MNKSRERFTGKEIVTSLVAALGIAATSMAVAGYENSRNDEVPACELTITPGMTTSELDALNDDPSDNGAVAQDIKILNPSLESPAALRVGQTIKLGETTCQIVGDHKEYIVNPLSQN